MTDPFRDWLTAAAIAERLDVTPEQVAEALRATGLIESRAHSIEEDERRYSPAAVRLVEREIRANRGRS
jgi:hypothetical protein